MNNKTVNIFIVIDALGWDYIKDRPFLDDIAITKRPVGSILGFSSGVMPSILTGRYPQEHKHWSLYFYSPKTSPFKWTKALLWLPEKILNSRIARKIIEEISKRIMGYSGYFETYLIPVKDLHLFDICENKNIYAPGGIRGADSILDILHKEKVDYKCFTYPLKDKDIFFKTKESIKASDSSFYFLYASGSDTMLHQSCQDKKLVNVMVDYYEKEIYDLFNTARQKFEKVNLFLLSDHSMALVDKGFNLKAEIENLGFKISEDYIPFYDSTMARFWFFNPKAKSEILSLLKNKDFGRVLSEEELKKFGIDFEGNMYGEIIFLMNTGSIINPSFMGNKIPQGMHGYGVDDGVMDAILVSNKKVEEGIKEVKDFFKIMIHSLGKQCSSAPVLQNSETSAPALQRSSAPVGKIKVLYFLNSIVRAGTEEYVLKLIEMIDRNRFDIVLVCPEELIDLIKNDLKNTDIRLYPVCIRRWRNIGEIRKFLNILKKERPHIVHSHLFFSTRFAAPLAKIAGVPVVVEHAQVKEGWRKGIKKAYFIDRVFYQFVDKVIAVADTVKIFLVYEKGLPEEKIEVIKNSVDIEKFKPSKVGDSSLPSTSLGTSRGESPSKEFTVGVIGRLEPQKGHRYFLEAVEMLNGRFQDIRFLIIGEGNLKDALEKKCRELNIEDRVEFLGYRKDMVSILNTLDLIVLPSLYEGLPFVALEAGAMEKPIIVTEVDGSPEVVIHNKTGIVVPPKNSLALKEAMELFINNRILARQFGSNARKHIEKEFDIKKQIGKTEELYKRLVRII